MQITPRKTRKTELREKSMDRPVFKKIPQKSHLTRLFYCSVFHEKENHHSGKRIRVRGNLLSSVRHKELFSTSTEQHLCRWVPIFPSQHRKSSKYQSPAFLWNVTQWENFGNPENLSTAGLV